VLNLTSRYVVVKKKDGCHSIVVMFERHVRILIRIASELPWLRMHGKR
jgi:hypothetical protein